MIFFLRVWSVVSQNEAPNEAKIHEKVSFVDPGPTAPYCKKFLCCTGRAFQEVPLLYLFTL